MQNSTDAKETFYRCILIVPYSTPQWLFLTSTLIVVTLALLILGVTFSLPLNTFLLPLTFSLPITISLPLTISLSPLIFSAPSLTFSLLYFFLSIIVCSVNNFVSSFAFNFHPFVCNFPCFCSCLFSC